MPLGIGAGGIGAIGLEDLPAPVQSALTTATTGGTIAAGTYKYMVTAINALGETLPSNEQSVTTTGATSTVTVTWAAVTGATGYKLYKTAAGGATGTELLYKTVGVVLTDTDTAPGTPTGAIPSVNTANTPGTYAAPDKYFPFNSETMKFQQDTGWRRPIRQSADVIGAVAGNAHAEGDVAIEVLEDVVVYFLMASRCSLTKTGTSPNFVYTFVPNSNAVPQKTFSLTLQRTSGAVFGYIGCVVSSMKWTVENGVMTVTFSLIANDEASQAAPTPTFTTTAPFGPGMYSVEVPTGTPVLDTDTFEFDVDDAGTPQFRMKNTGRGAQFISFGERTTTMHLERDFVDRTDYDAFKAYTSQSLTITASKGTNNSVSILVPVAIKDTYEVNLSGQGDLVRAIVQYQNVIDGTGKSYQLTVKTQENI